MGGANRSLDLPLVLAVVSVITVLVIVGNLIVDLVYVLLDPRAGAGDRAHADEEPRRRRLLRP